MFKLDFTIRPEFFFGLQTTEFSVIMLQKTIYIFCNGSYPKLVDQIYAVKGITLTEFIVVK